MRAREESYRDSARPLTFRDREQIPGYFSGTRLVDPGLVDLARWRPDTSGEPAPSGVYGGVGIVLPAAQ